MALGSAASHASTWLDPMPSSCSSCVYESATHRYLNPSAAHTEHQMNLQGQCGKQGDCQHDSCFSWGGVPLNSALELSSLSMPSSSLGSSSRRCKAFAAVSLYASAAGMAAETADALPHQQSAAPALHTTGLRCMPNYFPRSPI